MAHIRFAHFAAGVARAFGLVGRIDWAIVANHHARELVTLALLWRASWRELGAMAAWYPSLRPRPIQYVGRNPLARTAMSFSRFPPSLFVIATGFAPYGERVQEEHRTNRLGTSWAIAQLGRSQAVHTRHRLAVGRIVRFVMLHVYASIREGIMGRRGFVSTMISGCRTIKE
jgi:Ni/Fe-hydrogenase 1 B-type cytochrome subunit